RTRPGRTRPSQQPVRASRRHRRLDPAVSRARRIVVASSVDRIAAVEQISVDCYGLGLRFDWPRLWLVLPEHVQAEHAQASSQFAPAVVTGAWTLPYLVLGA
ncbi:hypothetical protein ADL27_53475, partial [Streptomyces sp. NRRL F-6602]